MSDEIERILAGLSKDDVSSDKTSFDRDAFDEEAYLRLNPDVALSVQSGEMLSGFDHFLRHGLKEGRPVPLEQANRLFRSPASLSVLQSHVANSCEALIASQGGVVFVTGWVEDTQSPLVNIRVSAPGWRIVFDMRSIMRLRRIDVEEALQKPVAHEYGFLGLVSTGAQIADFGECTMELFFADGTVVAEKLGCRVSTDEQLRDTALAMLAHADFLGSPAVERVGRLGAGLGFQFLNFNRLLTDRMVKGPYIERFGPRLRPKKGSIVVCLYGKAEFQFLQNALCCGLPGIDDYEFVYVSNSPEIGEALLREAKMGARIYGCDQTVVLLHGNAGFGAANNVAVRACESDRIVIMNPDVFPMDLDWAAQHSQLLDALPQERTRIFGIPLYYDDGSLMHAGMHFATDHHVASKGGEFLRRSMVRVEHYGKGAPPDHAALLLSRPVPAVTGAFISAERSWYEHLGGFTEDFVFGHYEDADLCLKSLVAGTPAWLHPIRMWHLEGKGSTRRPPHEGGSAVNRWLFSERWGSLVAQSIEGPNPVHPLLAAP